MPSPTADEFDHVVRRIKRLFDFVKASTWRDTLKYLELRPITEFAATAANHRYGISLQAEKLGQLSIGIESKGNLRHLKELHIRIRGLHFLQCSSSLNGRVSAAPCDNFLRKSIRQEALQ